MPKRKNKFEEELKSKLTKDPMVNLDFLLEIFSLENEKEFLEPTDKERYGYKNSSEKYHHKLYTISKLLYEESSKANELGLLDKDTVLGSRKMYHKYKGVILLLHKHLPL